MGSLILESSNNTPLAMKLLYVVAIAGLGYTTASNVSKSRASNGAQCKNAQSFKRAVTNNNPNEDAYDASVDAGVASWNAKDNEDADNNCQDPAFVTECRDMLETDSPSINNFRSQTGGDANCGAAADNMLQRAMLCSMCDLMRYAAEDDDCAQSGDEVCGSVSRSDTSNSDLDEQMKAAMLAVPETDDEDEEDQSIADSGKAKLTQTIKIQFSRVTGKVWNVIVSGGPEYCRDMLPKYPRVIYGKMRPGNPNYPAVVEIRDACVCLGRIVGACKCTCLYILWGSPYYPKGSPKNWQSKFGKKESNICYYLSNLKGTGVYRPKRKPVDGSCSKSMKLPGGKKPSGATNAGAIIKKLKMCMKKAQKKPVGPPRTKAKAMCKKKFKPTQQVQ